MGMRICAFRNKKDTKVVHYENAVSLGWNDDRLVALLRETGAGVNYDFTVLIDGEPLDNVDLTFSEKQFNQLLSVGKKIHAVSFTGEEDYAKKYSNETEDEYINRWGYIVNGLETLQEVINWDTDNMVVYISC